ncbi:hypothetical protein ACQ1PR_10225 [Ornithobacterium rhinotracheale]
MDFFRIVFSWFNGLYSQEFYDFLSGWSCFNQDYSNVEYFTRIGLFTIVTTLIFVYVFYYVINHPRFSRWYHWLISLIVYFVWSYVYVYNLVYSGVVEDCLLYRKNENGEDIQLITGTDFFGLAFTVAIFTAFLFLLFSIVLKWKSRNAKHCPF